MAAEIQHTFKTHSFFLEREGRFVRSTFVINQHIYFEMIAASDGWLASDFLFDPRPIENERYLIYRFIRGIVREPNNRMHFFRDDEAFHKFCLSHDDVTYQSQSWFKIVYFEDSVTNVESYLMRCSLSFQDAYFPPDTPCTRDLHLRDPRTLGIQQYKPDFQDIFDELKRQQVNTLYHFTDKDNLRSIFENGGLLSNRDIVSKGIKPHYSTSEESRMMDKRANLDDYVRVSFVRENPMMFLSKQAGRVNQPVIIQVDPHIMLRPEVYFSDRNALDHQAIIGQSAQYLKNINFDLLRRPYYDIASNEGLKSKYQAEVMVRNRVGIEFFLNADELRKQL